MLVRVIGLFCPRTEQVLINAQAALKEFDRRGNVEWISDVHKMILLGVRYTPALYVHGKLKATGRVPSVYEITTWIQEELVEEPLA